MDANEGQPKSVVDRIKELEQQELLSGERRETSFGTFHFWYMSDPRYQNADPAVRAAIEQLNIPEITVTGTEKVIKELKIKRKPTVTTVIPTNEDMRYVTATGFGGRALSPTEVITYFDPTHPQVVESLKMRGKRLIAHEFNHIARLQAGKEVKTLLDALISEGLATYYQEHLDGIYQSAKPPAVPKLGETVLKTEWVRARTELHSKGYNFGEWFFGENGKHPRATGYVLGSIIVNAYISKHPQVPMADLVRKSSAEILKKSGFA